MIDIDISKYENSVINNIDKDNVRKIIYFLLEEKCNYVGELLEEYLDIFTFDYSEFVSKYNKLNEKYNHDLINVIREDMNILEEFYY